MTVKSIDDLKKRLEVEKLDERLELMIILPGIEVFGAENTCCCGVDSNCTPTTPPPKIPKPTE